MIHILHISCEITEYIHLTKSQWLLMPYFTQMDLSGTLEGDTETSHIQHGAVITQSIFSQNLTKDTPLLAREGRLL